MNQILFLSMVFLSFLFLLCITPSQYLTDRWSERNLLNIMPIIRMMMMFSWVWCPWYILRLTESFSGLLHDKTLCEMLITVSSSFLSEVCPNQHFCKYILSRKHFQKRYYLRNRSPRADCGAATAAGLYAHLHHQAAQAGRRCLVRHKDKVNQ